MEFNAPAPSIPQEEENKNQISQPSEKEEQQQQKNQSNPEQEEKKDEIPNQENPKPEENQQPPEKEEQQQQQQPQPKLENPKPEENQEQPQPQPAPESKPEQNPLPSNDKPPSSAPEDLLPPRLPTDIPSINSSRIEVSILQGHKFFNENIPFVINLTSPDIDEKKSNVDLICVIDVSGSMDGMKIEYVKSSVKILMSMMDKNDRLCIILFDTSSNIFIPLSYTTEENKKKFEIKINNIFTRGGTNIISGLEKAVEVLIEEKKNQKEESNRVSSVILLSDGCDNYMNDIQIADKLKEKTKGHGLLFTLHTFGYGSDHDPKIMNRLANLRDGSFYYVAEIERVQEYFVSVLGGCMSVISKLVKMEVSMINKDGGKNNVIKKVFGINNLYNKELKDDYFMTEILQFISGKEYTFVMEVNLGKAIAINEEIIKVKLTYEDNLNEKVNDEFLYKNKIVESLDKKETDKADKEYIRSQVFDVLDEAVKLKDRYKNDEAKNILNKMKNWLIDRKNKLEKEKNGDDKIKKEVEDLQGYIKHIDDTFNMLIDDRIFESIGRTCISTRINEGQFKRSGQTLTFTNTRQTRMINESKKICSIPKTYLPNFSKSKGKFFDDDEDDIYGGFNCNYQTKAPYRGTMLLNNQPSNLDDNNICINTPQFGSYRSTVKEPGKLRTAKTMGPTKKSSLGKKGKEGKAHCILF